MIDGVEKGVLQIVRRHGRGWVFSAKDFVHLGARSAVDMALHRMEGGGVVRRIGRGLYYYPRYSKVLNSELSADVSHIAAALARKFGWRIQVTGPTALNMMGLSTQVPGRAIFLSDGPGRKYSFGNQQIEFIQSPLKDTGFKHEETAVIVAGLKSLGDAGITPDVIAAIRRWLKPGLRRYVLRESMAVVGWVQAAIVEICGVSGDG